MTRTAGEIYRHYRVPPNLQEHMLRVAYAGREIACGWREKGKVDAQRVTAALLLHDTANILKYDFNASLGLMGREAQRAGYWKSVQADYARQYGRDEHRATMAIARELGAGGEVLHLLEGMPQVNETQPVPEGEWELAVCFYADFRVAPFGIAPTDIRLEDLIRREKAKGSPVTETERLNGIKRYLHRLETEIGQRTSTALDRLDEKGFRQVREALLSTLL